MAHTDDMTTGRPGQLLVRFALPMMAGNVFQMLYSVADGAVVGRLIGVRAFAAIGATGFTYLLLFHIVLGLTQGFGTRLAQRFGAGDRSAFRRAAGATTVLVLLFGAALSAAGLFLARPMLVLQGTPKDILDDAARYLQIMGGGMLLTAMYNMAANALRSIGDSRTPVFAMVISTLINVALDIALVLLTGWGVGAVAVATLIAQAVAVLCCVHALRKWPDCMPKRTDLRLDGPETAQLLRLGVPGAVRNAVASLGGLVVQSVINSYGTVFVAGVALPNKLQELMGIVSYGMEGAVAVFVAQNAGARHMDRIQEGVSAARRMMIVSSLLIAMVLAVAGGPLMALMIDGEGAEAVLAVAQKQLYVVLAGLPFLSLLVMYRAAVQGMGDAKTPMISGFVELLARLACVLLLVRVIGEWGVYMAVSVGWPVAMCVVLFAYRRKVLHEPYESVTGNLDC